jgi:hypothetical protein
MNSILVILKEWYDARYGILLACAGLSALAFFVMFMENRQYDDSRKKQRKWLEGYAVRSGGYLLASYDFRYSPVPQVLSPSLWQVLAL